MKSVCCIATIMFTGMAYAATPVTSCTTISTPGNYFLTGDLSGANCIVINASNVSLALNNHAITGPGGTGVGITVTPISGRLDRVGISGPGLITGFQNGIAISNSAYVQVSLVTASGNASNGITSSGTNNSFLTIASNILTQNGVWGALLTADNSSVTGNEMPGNGGSPGSHATGGMRMSGAGNTISGNVASGNPKLDGNTITLNAGILVSTTASRIFGNIADGNVSAGIRVSGTGNQLFNNKALGNTINDLQDDNANCDANLWADNTFFTRNPASCVK